MGLGLRRRGDPEWESTCRQCGLCCYERERIAGGVLIDLRKPCSYLDTRTRRCTVYRRRFAVAAYCSKVNLLHALFGRRMPLTCAYVKRYRRALRGS